MPVLRIRSKKNEQVRLAKRLHQKKYRDQLGLFYIEGVRSTEEALSSGLIHSLFYSPRLLDSPRGKELLVFAETRGFPIYECGEAVFGELTNTVASQGVFALVTKPRWAFVPRGLLLIADEIQDPGNMGTLLRTAAGVGATGLIIVDGSVDLFNPKVVRASMGAVLKLPHWFYPRHEVRRLVRVARLPLVVADLEEAVDCFSVQYPQNLALVIGNEARGVHPLFRQDAALRVKIPLKGPVESLNAAVAAGVLLYEIYRQHRSDLTHKS